ncbi:MAG: SRPBCC domain-containing protein, partial [Candidatus Aminicenantales bacterium]
MDPMNRQSLTTPPPGSILVIDRVFDAPRERVWMAWTDPDLVRRWWGPKGFTTPVCRISLRVGG